MCVNALVWILVCDYGFIKPYQALIADQRCAFHHLPMVLKKHIKVFSMLYTKTNKHRFG